MNDLTLAISSPASAKRSAQHGFALVIALSLMSFVLVLVLSITTLVQVEVRAAENTLARLQAKEAAKLALYMAIGDLQKHAGPDQRVTARADILEPEEIADGARFWTGVWDTENPAQDPYWLVSGTSADPSTLSTSSYLQIIGSETVGDESENYVFVPRVQFDGGEIGWWVGDEGIKASLTLEDRIDSLHADFLEAYNPAGLSTTEQRQILRQISPRRFRSEIFLGSGTDFTPGDTEDLAESAVRNRVIKANDMLNRTMALSGFELLEEVNYPSLETYFHDVTYRAEAILSDTANGGLKTDLSDTSFTTSTGPLVVDTQLHSFLWGLSPDINGNLALTGLPESEINLLEEGSLIASTPPIITECALYFAVSGQSKNSRSARAFLRLEVELWSPYGYRHAFMGSSGSNTPEITVEFENLPTIDLSFYDKDTESFTNSTTLPLDTLSPIFELDLTETHKSGEIRKITGSWTANASANAQNFYYTNGWEWAVNDLNVNSDHRSVSFPDGDSINYQGEEATIKILFKNSSGEILQEIDGLHIQPIEADFGFYEDTPSGLSASDAPIVFYYRVIDDRVALEKWLTENDLRAIQINLADAPIAENIFLNDLADIPPVDSFSNLDLFHGVPNNNFFRIFDTPSTIPYSLGVLQHAQLKDRPPYSIGNPWGASANGTFDRYFVSGIPQDSASDYWKPDMNPRTNPLPNPFVRINPYRKKPGHSEIVGSDSAKHLLISGAFNVNSTSTKAWEAVLAGNFIYDWEMTRNKGTSTEESERRINLEAGFFRLPFSGHIRSKAWLNWKFPFEDFEDETDPEDEYPKLSDDDKMQVFKKPHAANPDKDWRPSLAIGHRENHQEDLEILAHEITSRLKQRSTPFVSMEEFINSGILQQSIDQTSINTIQVENEDGVFETEHFPRNAPAFLSQADLISAIAPFASARSDTFTIRTKARITNSADGTVEGSASLLAVVQRIPTRVDQDESLVMENADGSGRKFIIKDFQWLEE